MMISFGTIGRISLSAKRLEPCRFFWPSIADGVAHYPNRLLSRHQRQKPLPLEEKAALRAAFSWPRPLRQAAAMDLQIYADKRQSQRQGSQ